MNEGGWRTAMPRQHKLFSISGLRYLDGLDGYILREVTILARYCAIWHVSDRQAIELGFAERYAQRHPR